MLDVEFLRQRPRPGRAVVYQYRTGVLRRRVIAVLAEQAAAEGRDLITCGFNDLLGDLGGGNLLVSFHGASTIYDWAHGPKRNRAARMGDALTAFAALADDCVALFVPEGSAPTKHPSWPEVEAASLVIKEPIITPKTLLPILCYLEESTDLADTPKLSTQPAFVASFDGFLRQRGDLSDLVWAFEDRVLVYTDPTTHVFDARRYAVDEYLREGCTSPLRLLRDLIAGQDAWDLAALVMRLDQRQRQGWTATAVIKEVYRITDRVLNTDDGGSEPKHLGGSDVGDGQELAPLLWAALVLAWEARLVHAAQAETSGAWRGPSLLIAALDQLGRAFLERAYYARGADGLEGLWPELQAALDKVARCKQDPLSRARDRTARGLLRRMVSASHQRDASWPARLLRLTAAAVEQAEREIARQEAEEDDDKGDQPA